MIPVEIKSRDGLTLPSYLTLPKGADKNGDGKADKPVPMVLFVHGGPGRATAMATTATTSGWPTAATRCWPSTTAPPPASARSSSTPATSSGA